MVAAQHYADDGLSRRPRDGVARRRLRHAPVVRSFGIIGRIDPRGSNVGQITNTLRLPREWKRENLRAVVFVQEHDTLRITGAAVAELR